MAVDFKAASTRSLSSVLFVIPLQPQAVGDVLEDRLRKRIRLLKHHADPHPHLDRIDARGSTMFAPLGCSMISPS